MPRNIKKSRWSAIVLGSLLLLAILIAYHLNFSGREKSIIRLKLFYCDRDGYHCEKEGPISVQVTLRQEAANCKSFARSSMSVAKLGNVFV